MGQTSPAPKAPVEQLIPRLLDEDEQLHGVPVSEQIFDTTGRKVPPFATDNAIDQRVAKTISRACDETMKRLSAPDSKIQNIDRINVFRRRRGNLHDGILSICRGLPSN